MKIVLEEVTWRIGDQPQDETSENKENESNVTENKETENNESESKEAEKKEKISFIKPVQGAISSRYGMRNPSTNTVPKNHTGVDIAANIGTPIKSATDGEVIQVSSEGDYGNHVKIQTGEIITVYAHCNKIYVKEGEHVTQGQEIAEVGSTGNSTGPHLHFEIRVNNNTVDPETMLEL